MPSAIGRTPSEGRSPTSRGTSAPRWPAGWRSRTPPRTGGSSPRVQGRSPSRFITRSCRSRRRPIGGPRSAGGSATSRSGSAGGRPACGCRRRPSTWQRCGMPRPRASSSPSSPRGRRRPAASTPVDPTGSSSAMTAPSSSSSTTGACRRRPPSSPRRRPMPTGSPASASRRAWAADPSPSNRRSR